MSVRLSTRYWCHENAHFTSYRGQSNVLFKFRTTKIRQIVSYCTYYNILIFVTLIRETSQKISVSITPGFRFPGGITKQTQQQSRRQEKSGCWLLYSAHCCVLSILFQSVFSVFTFFLKSTQYKKLVPIALRFTY